MWPDLARVALRSEFWFTFLVKSQLSIRHFQFPTIFRPLAVLRSFDVTYESKQIECFVYFHISWSAWLVLTKPYLLFRLLPTRHGVSGATRPPARAPAVAEFTSKNEPARRQGASTSRNHIRYSWPSSWFSGLTSRRTAKVPPESTHHATYRQVPRFVSI